MGYNLKNNGWLNNSTKENNQAMKEDNVPWRGAHEKCHKFFSIIFSTLTDKDGIIMDWNRFVLSSFILFGVQLSLVLIAFPIGFRNFTSFHFDVSRPQGQNFKGEHAMHYNH